MTRWIVALALSLPAVSLAQAKCPVDGAALSPDTVVGSLDGKPITLAQVDAHDASALCKARVEHRQQLDAIRQGALEDLIEDTLLAREAKARKTTVEDLLDDVAQKAEKPTEAQAKMLYDMYAAQNQGQQIDPFEKVKEEIIDALGDKAAEEAQRTFVAELKAKAKVQMSLPPLRLPVEAKGFGKGPKDAPITVVMFADYECPYCSRGAANLAQAAKAFEGKVRIVYRDYPLGFHARAVPSAIAARCAGAQGKYYEMHDLLYEHQDALGDDNLKAYAQQLKLDMKAFEACQGDAKTKAAVDADFAAGAAAGVDGTPAFFINGIKLGGAQPPEAFTDIFKQELARKKR